MAQRMEKVNELIAETIARILHDELDLSTSAGDVFVTIVRVVTSPTLEHATVWISVLPESQSHQTLTLINGEVYRIQQVLNQSLTMRKIPKVSFKLDRTEEQAAHIEQLLKNV